MPLPDTIQTYTYYITQISSMKLAYVQFVRDIPFMDIPVPIHPYVKKTEDNCPNQAFKRGTPHDILAAYARLIKPLPSDLEEHSEEAIRGAAMPKPEFDSQNPTPTRLLVNGELTLELAEELIGQGVIDAAVFGQLWIGNPDLQKRFEKGLFVNTTPDPLTYYNSVDAGSIREGYTTYPEATELAA